MDERPIILVSDDLKTRSYLRAQLLEEGAKVRAFNTIDDARHWIYIGGRVPAMVVVDTWRSRFPPESVKWLRDISDRCPVTFLTGARDRPDPELEEIGETIRRPISVAEVIRRIRSRSGS
jgi:DNA-binding NtrC family response regulator